MTPAPTCGPATRHLRRQNPEHLVKYVLSGIPVVISSQTMQRQEPPHLFTCQAHNVCLAAAAAKATQSFSGLALGCNPVCLTAFQSKNIIDSRVGGSEDAIVRVTRQVGAGLQQPRHALHEVRAPLEVARRRAARHQPPPGAEAARNAPVGHRTCRILTCMSEQQPRHTRFMGSGHR